VNPPKIIRLPSNGIALGSIIAAKARVLHHLGHGAVARLA
jgi:hypothetical protein